MTSPALNRIYDTAKVYLPGALDAAMQLEFFQLLDDFFSMTNCWTEDIQFPVTVTTLTYLEDPLQYTYTLTPSLGLIIRTATIFNRDGVPVPATMPVPGDLVLVNGPNTADTYTARVILTVSDPLTREGNTQLPEWVLNKYSGCLLEGLVGRMMMQPAKPYTAKQDGLFHMKNYLSGRSDAKIEAARQNVYGGQAWQFPQQFATRRWR